jgi:hypothetical protein
MAQEYHNIVTLTAPLAQRQAFLADALAKSPQWEWDWLKVIINDDAVRGRDRGSSLADWYSRGFPDGLEELMQAHPEVTLVGNYMDISAGTVKTMKTKANQVLEDSGEQPLE